MEASPEYSPTLITSSIVSLRVNSDCRTNGTSSKAISALKTTAVNVKSPIANLYDRFACFTETGLWPMMRDMAILTARLCQMERKEEKEAEAHQVEERTYSAGFCPSRKADEIVNTSASQTIRLLDS